MKFSLEIVMTNTEGALERILGCLRQRGFALCSIVANLSHDHASLLARVTLESSRPLEMAVKQVRKLYEVHHVVVERPEAGRRHLHAAARQV